MARNKTLYSKIIELLSDGLPHNVDELFSETSKSFGPELNRKNLCDALYYLRKRRGDIVCVKRGVYQKKASENSPEKVLPNASVSLPVSKPSAWEAYLQELEALVQKTDRNLAQTSAAEFLEDEKKYQESKQLYALNRQIKQLIRAASAPVPPKE